jgi:hypothetical protein
MEVCGPCPVFAIYTLTTKEKAQKTLSQGTRCCVYSFWAPDDGRKKPPETAWNM